MSKDKTVSEEKIMKWEDTTSYSRGKERVPTCWSVRVGKLKISVLTSNIYYPGRWVMNCNPLFDTLELNVLTKEEAQEKALLLVRNEINAVLSDISMVDVGIHKISEALLGELKTGIIEAVYSKDGLDRGNGTYLISAINNLLELPVDDYNGEGR